MTKILIVTVGESSSPIVTSIKTKNPDRVIFICSDGTRSSKSQVIGKGTPCEIRKNDGIIERLPNIPTQAGLGDKFDLTRDLISLKNPDDLAQCYQLTIAKIQEIQQSFPNSIIESDYTGGTKSMSVGLAIASIDSGIDLLLTTGIRNDLVSVKRGEMTSRTDVSSVLIQRIFDRFIPTFLQKYNYSAVVAELTQLMVLNTPSPERREQIHSISDICSALDAWDRFDHLTALEFLRPFMINPQIKTLGLFLKRSIGSRGAIDPTYNSVNGMIGNGYEIAYDLLLNAQRRAIQCRYDDAVARLYRGLELLAQLRLLKQYDLRTGDVDVAKLPEALRPDYQKYQSNGKIQISLLQSYELLLKLDDPIGKLYSEQRNQIIGELEKRNISILAHGFRQVTQSDYQAMERQIGGFINTAVDLVIPVKSKFSPVQFPSSLKDMMEI